MKGGGVWMKGKDRNLFREEAGTTAIEYALICASIVAAVAVAVPLIGSSVLGLFESVVEVFSS
jgi:Flp pilus assembly pilin Flp